MATAERLEALDLGIRASQMDADLTVDLAADSTVDSDAGLTEDLVSVVDAGAGVGVLAGDGAGD